MPVYYCTLPVTKRPSTAVYTAIRLITNQRRSCLKDVCILGRTRSGGVYYCVRTLPNTFSSVPLPSTLPRVGGKVQFQLHKTLFRSGIDLIIRLAFYSALETAPLSLCSAMVTPTRCVSHTGGTMCGGREWQVNHTRRADKRCVHLTHQTHIHLELMYRWSR